MPEYKHPGNSAHPKKLHSPTSTPCGHRLIASNCSIPPNTEEQKSLAQIWQQLLGIEAIGIHDNFFELGGSSLDALRMSQLASRNGMTLPVIRRECATITQLLRMTVRDDDLTDDQNVVVGPAPLTPAQLRFLYDRKSTNPHYWNLATVMQARALNPESLSYALASVLKQHDALRLRLTLFDGVWQQEITGVPDDPPFSTQNIAHLDHNSRIEAIESACSSLQCSLNLIEGPVIRVAHFDCGQDEPDRLFVAIHHFAVDAISLPVFWEDFEAAYLQSINDESIQLPRRTMSFRKWTSQLSKLVRLPRISNTADEWLDLPWDKVTRIPFDFEYRDGDNINASTDAVAIELDTVATAKLVHLAGDVRIEQILIATFASCLSQWSASDTILVDLLNHGRDAVMEGDDLSRTVGFTLFYSPLVLNIPASDKVLDRLRSVTEQINSFPDGYSYDLLRCYSADHALRGRFQTLPHAEVLLNFIGRDKPGDRNSLFTTAPESPGHISSPQGLREYPLAVRVSVDDVTRFSFVFSRNLHRRETIESLAGSLCAELDAIIDSESASALS